MRKIMFMIALPISLKELIEKKAKEFKVSQAEIVRIALYRTFFETNKKRGKRKNARKQI